ncbi:hypothetical protein J6590_074085, partial [Homalodisca vitripennis]
MRENFQLCGNKTLVCGKTLSYSLLTLLSSKIIVIIGIKRCPNPGSSHSGTHYVRETEGKQVGCWREQENITSHFLVGNKMAAPTAGISDKTISYLLNYINNYSSAVTEVFVNSVVTCKHHAGCCAI